MKRSIKKFMLTALLLCVTVLLGSCSFLEGEQQPQVQNYSELTQTEVFPVRLEIGEQSYLISSRPHSFAVLSADLAQALEDMGVASMITALCSDAPAGISSSGTVDCGTVLDPNIEQIIAARPDRVLVSSQMRQSSLEQLEQAGLQVIQFEQPQDIDSIKQRYRQLYTLCYGSEGTARAQTFWESYQQALDAAISPAAEYVRVSSKKQVIYLADLPLTMATGETFEGQLLNQMGFVNLGELGSRWKYPEVELGALQPEIIFYDNTLSPEQIIESETYAQTPAVQSEQLYAVDFAAIRLKGLPMISELAKMAQAAYPQAYSGS